MICLGLKKFAKENDLTIENGIAYGILFGYVTTLSRTITNKKLVITTDFTNEQGKSSLQTSLNSRNLRGDFGITEHKVTDNTIEVSFNNAKGSTKKMVEFIKWFYTTLADYSVQKADVCSKCGKELSGGVWVVKDDVAYYIHENCAD